MSWREDLAVGILRLGKVMAQEPELQKSVADGPLEAEKSFHQLDADDATVDMTLTPADRTVYFFSCVNADNSVTITLDGTWTFDGTNNIATFDVGDGLIAMADLEKEILGVMANNGVVLSV